MAHRSERLRRLVHTPARTETPVLQRQMPPTISQTVTQRAVRHPETLTPSDVMVLQRSIGNQAVQRLLADEQRKFVNGMRAPSGGHPLPPDVQAKMETSFGTDFSNVRVHEGPQADAIQARAYTQGNHIVFAQREYNPHSQSGQNVLAHELAHVVQQRSGRVMGRGGGISIDPSPSLENEAHRAAAKAVNGTPAGLSVTKNGVQRASANTIQRLPKWLKKIGRGIKNFFSMKYVPMEEDMDANREYLYNFALENFFTDLRPKQKEEEG